MTIQVHFEQMQPSATLEQRVIRKLQKLNQKYPWMIGAQVTLKTKQENEEQNKYCSIKISAPGPYLFADAHTDDFEKATKEAILKIDKQLEKRKRGFASA